MTDTPRKGRPAGLSRADLQCVSFLTLQGLLSHLKLLVATGAIGHYWAVEHQPDDEHGKVHQHVRMSPPLSRAVNWFEVAKTVQETVKGELLPRCLVVRKSDVNDKAMDGLLYARHDSRYLSAKGLVKAHVDYPRTSFFTDDDNWLDSLWAESETFEPEPRKLSKADVLAMLEGTKGQISRKDLIKVCILNGFTQGDYNLLYAYAEMLRGDAING